MLPSIAAVAMGACVIEKHFTLDRTMEGTDHKPAWSRKELKAMVQAIRHIDQALGDGIKKLSWSEGKIFPTHENALLLRALSDQGEVLTRIISRLNALESELIRYGRMKL